MADHTLYLLNISVCARNNLMYKVTYCCYDEWFIYHSLGTYMIWISCTVWFLSHYPKLVVGDSCTRKSTTCHWSLTWLGSRQLRKLQQICNRKLDQ